MKVTTKGFGVVMPSVLIFCTMMMIQGAWAAGIEMSGDVSVSGTLSATAVTGDGSGLTNISGAALSNASVTQDKLAGGTVGPIQLANEAVTPMKISFYGKVAIVAVNGGDYSDPAAAMSDLASWCRPADDTTTPCLVKIMPGVYDVGGTTVVMQPYVDIEGSGEKVTTITGAIASESWPPNGTVNGANNAEIRLLTVSNAGVGSYATAMLNNGNSPAVTNVTATALGGTTTYGVINAGASSKATMTNVTVTASGGTDSNGVYNNSSSPTMTNVTVTASGGFYSYGVHNTSSSPTMTTVTITASGATSNNNGVVNEFSASPKMTNVAITASGGTTTHGIASYSSSPTMTNVTITASGGTNNYGVYTSNIDSKATMTNVIATASGGTNNYGVYNYNTSPIMTNVTVTAKEGTTNLGVFSTYGGTVKINHSVIRGTSHTIYNQAGVTTMVGNTQLDGGAVDNAGTLTCVGTYDGNYIALGTNCQP